MRDDARPFGRVIFQLIHFANYLQKGPDRIALRGWGGSSTCLRLGPQAGDGRFICVRCGALQFICYAGWIDPIKVPVKQEVHE